MNNPVLSIIVPIYNVEKYLEECIDSLVNQTLNNIEIILVNDGSTDSSGVIADRYANNYENVSVYHKVNGGLGQARNYGTKYASGDYIAFVDSDDYLTHDAYSKLYNTIVESDSDIAIGNVVRFNSTKIYPSVLHQKVFSEDKLNAHISKNPELMYDTTAWNKIFKRKFWEKHNLNFPEGMLYEDLPVTIPAHFLAKSVDVITDVIYYWRARDEGDQSITQQRTDLRNLVDRLKAVKMVDQYFQNNVHDSQLKIAKDFKALDTDLLVYLNQLDNADETYIKTYLDEVSLYLSTVETEAFNKLKAIDRLKYHFVEQKDKEKVLEIIKFQKQELRYSKIERKGNDYFGNYPYSNEVPSDLLKLNNELVVKKKIESMKWTGSILNVKGYAYVKDIDIKNQKNMKVNAVLVNEDSGEKYILSGLKQCKRKDITYKFGIDISDKLPLKRLYNYDWSGWEIDIDFTDPKILKMTNGKMKILLSIDANGIKREFPIGAPVKGRVSKPKYRILEDNIIFLKYNASWDLIVQKDELLTKVNHVKLISEGLHVLGKTKLPIREGKLCLINYKASEEVMVEMDPIEPENKDDSNFIAKIPMESLNEIDLRGDWFGHVLYNSEYTPLTTDIELFGERWTFGQNELKVSHSPAGNLLLKVGDFSVNVNKVSYEEKKIKIELLVAKGYLNGDYVCKLLLENNKLNKVISYDTKIIEKENEKVILECVIDPLDDKVGIEEGTWEVYLINNYAERKDRVYYDLENIDKQSKTYGKNKFTSYRGKHNNKAFLKVKKEWDWIERGPRRQEVIKKLLYPLMRLLPQKKKTVVFESYWGKSFDCNPRALYEYIDENHKDFETVWFLKNTGTKINGSGKKVRINSFKYYYYLAAAKYFVNNVNFPDFYRKRSSSKELQTMHGTPLKTLGLDVPGDVDTEPKKSKFLNRCSRWDYLTVPSNYVAEVAKSAFEFDRDILRVGYPRNDKLFHNNNDAYKEKIKRELNIPLDKKIILYAPTWRIKNKFNIEMDIDKLQKELSNEYIILFKFHHFVSNSINLPNNDFIHNVSRYDDIRDLYLISDILITDYSSVMFDYAILNKPQILFTYDLENYRDKLRGMYLDITEYAPGPLTRNTDELLDAIKKVHNYHNDYDAQIQLFRNKFCEYDDGHASEKTARDFLSINNK
ncbi:CDP-glycerol glycerophosphotransferase family protein [Cytobacillus horneckiae]|uniref:CDP-glycerol glycerophosphotransferase family protein n=1 Tax=Cytobacillus horneckiae TaxID=549687 RepID=UPI003D9A5205